MFGSRRPGKRSIVGTKVCALFEDGFYRPGVIQSVHLSPTSSSSQSYSVMFDEGGVGVFRDFQLVGPGFQGLNKSNLKIGQTVFITYNNREVKGRILGNKDVELNGSQALKYWLVGIGEDNENVVRIKLDDIRLLESRKSARLSDQDTDYVKLADIPTNESKKRASFIDVPNFAIKQCKSNHVHNKREDVNITKDIEMEVMDENMAAMVLTSLSCSPVSPLPSNFASEIACPNTEYPGNTNSSYIASCSGSSSPTDSNLSQSAPSTIFTFSQDENNFSQLGFSKRTVYQCTWPGCKQIYNTCPGIEKHIRMEHLGPENISDHEEEFYYSEIEVVMDSHHNDVPLSPTMNHNFFTSNSDHNYQRRDSNNLPILITERSHGSGKEPSLSKSLPWQMSEQGFSFFESSSAGIVTTNGLMKNLVQKKPRAEVKKCRKVYGLENRASWCTQCKWKKACTRFQERPFDIIS